MASHPSPQDFHADLCGSSRGSSLRKFLGVIYALLEFGLSKSKVDEMIQYASKQRRIEPRPQMVGIWASLGSDFASVLIFYIILRLFMGNLGLFVTFFIQFWGRQNDSIPLRRKLVQTSVYIPKDML